MILSLRTKLTKGCRAFKRVWIKERERERKFESVINLHYIFSFFNFYIYISTLMLKELILVTWSDTSINLFTVHAGVCWNAMFSSLIIKYNSSSSSSASTSGHEVSPINDLFRLHLCTRLVVQINYGEFGKVFLKA